MSQRVLVMAVLCGLISVAAAAGEPPGEDPATYKLEDHLFARSVHMDGDGRCQATGGVKLKAWYVAGFPASIPPFESCTTIASDTGRGTVDIELAVVDARRRTLQKVDGVLDLGSDGKATQAIDWDHLEVPGPGLYHMVIKVDGQEIGRYPMKFRKRRPSRGRKK